MAAAAPDPAPVLVVAHAPRARTRTLVRAGLNRRSGHLAVTRTVDALEARLRDALVDAVVVDLGAAEGAPLAAAALAREFPSVAFVAVCPYRPVDAPAIARCAQHGVVDVLADGVDDALVRATLGRHGFRARFAFALAEPPPALGLTDPLPRRVWGAIVGRVGSTVRTGELAGALRVTREHLSRAVARTPARSLKRVVDLVRLLAAAELAKNPGYGQAEVARLLRWSSAGALDATCRRLVGRPATSLSRLRAVDLVGRYATLVSAKAL